MSAAGNGFLTFFDRLRPAGLPVFFCARAAILSPALSAAPVLCYNGADRKRGGENGRAVGTLRGRGAGAARAGGFPLPCRARPGRGPAGRGDRPLLLCRPPAAGRNPLARRQRRHPPRDRELCGGSHAAGQRAGAAQRRLLQLPPPAPGGAGPRAGKPGQRPVHQLPDAGNFRPACRPR